MSDTEEPTEVERAARLLARHAEIDADDLPTTREDDAQRIMQLASRQRQNVQHRDSMHEWRVSSLIVTTIGGALDGVGALAQTTLDDQSSLVHLHATLLHPLMVVPTIIIAATGIVCQARHSLSAGAVHGVNRRVRRLAALHSQLRTRL